MAEDLIAAINRNMTHFSKGQKLIATYIMEHYDKSAFMTASRLGQTVGTSESTVVRFASELGYDGYPHLQKELQRMARIKLTSVQRMEVGHEILGNEDIISTVMHGDIDKIRKTLESVDKASFDAVVESILGARRIYILGVRSSLALAAFLGFYFNLIFDSVHTFNSSSASEMFEHILHAGSGDLVIGISFPRYSSRTKKAMAFARQQGATVVAITDSESSPLTEIANNCLFARGDMVSFVDSLVAPLSLINALIVAVGLKKGHELSITFDKLERIWEEYNVYDKPSEN